MSSGGCAALQAACDAAGIRCAVTAEQWDAFSKGIGAEGRFKRAVAEKRASDVADMLSESVGKPRAEDGSTSPAFDWDALERAISLGAVSEAVPASMMGGIEDAAQRLAKKIASGDASLETLDMEAIGREVLSGVSEEDMTSFADNVEKLMPALARGMRG